MLRAHGEESGVKKCGFALLLAALLMSAPAASEDATREEMAKIFEAMQYLMPLSLSEAKFSDPAERERILKSLALIESSSASLEQHGNGQDAGFSYLSSTLAMDARDVHERFSAGHVRETQFMVQQIAENCMACHSRLPSEDARLSQEFVSESKIERLPVDQRAKLEYATRQFGRALTSYEALLADPDFSPTDLDMLGFLDEYLELCIRVRQDFERPRRALQKFSKRQDVTPVLRGAVEKWIDSLGALQTRTPLSDPLSDAMDLIATASDPEQYDDEREALVYYVHASGVLHRYVARRPTDRRRLAEAYYQLGVIEMRIGQSFWLSQAEAYLEGAIRTVPGEPTAQRAFDLLEEFLIAGYSGSGGTNVPPDVQARLDELSELADKPAES